MKDGHSNDDGNTGGWSRELLYQLVENVKDYAIFVSGLDGRIVSWNIGGQKIFGYTAEEAIGMDSALLFTPEDRAAGEPEKEMRTARENGCAEDERWHVRKDGSLFFASGVQTPLYDKSEKHTGYAKIARDLTERIKIQEELHAAYDSIDNTIIEKTSELSAANKQLRMEIVDRKRTEELRIALLRKIVSTQEGERKRIARDIHDNIGQQMTAMQLSLKHVLDLYSEDPESTAQIIRLQEIANQIDSEVDFLAWELRPSVLDDVGLASAMDKYVREWSDHFSIPAEFRHIGMEDKRLLPEIEINLYRIAQEALNNVAKHAEPSLASVLLEGQNGTVRLIVEDDGKGFRATADEVFSGEDRGLGLLGMKERAELFGGNLEIESFPGSGTTVFVRVPAMFEEAAA